MPLSAVPSTSVCGRWSKAKSLSDILEKDYDGNPKGV